MNGNVIDTLRLANRLKDAGFEPHGAEGIAQALSDELEGRVVTKSYVDTALERTENRLGAAIADVGSQIAALGQALDGKLSALDAKIDVTADRLDAKIDATADRLDAKIDATAARLDAKIDATAAQLDAKIDDTAARLDAKIDDTRATLDGKMDLIDANQHKRHDSNARWVIFLAGLLFAMTLAAGVPQYLRMFGIGYPWPPQAAATVSASDDREGDARTPSVAHSELETDEAGPVPGEPR